MTIYNASKMLAGTQPKVLPTAGGVNTLSTIALTTPLAVNDTINFVTLGADAADPAGGGPTIIGLVLDSDKLDTNASPTIKLNLGDAGSATRYFNQTPIAQQGGYAIPTTPAILGFQPFAAAFNTYPTPSLATYTIFATCQTAAATWQNGTIRLLTEYTYDP
jgi:hypothetical protein